MKIAIIAPSLSGRGGEETVIKKVMDSHILKEQGLDIHLIILGKCEHREWLNSFNNRSYITNTENEINNFMNLLQDIKKKRYGEIICLSRKSILYGYLIRSFSRIPFKIISWIHFNLDFVNTSFLKLADCHLAISRSILEQFVNKKISESKNIYLINNPVNLSSDVVMRPHTNSFIYIGRIQFNGQKNFRELIDNLAYLEFNNWSLDVIGDGVDVGKCRKYIQKNYPIIMNNIKWHGWHDNPWEVIKSADALILTSKYEGLPMVLCEAISRGLPCLSSLQSGTKGLIASGVNGENYQLGDKKQFAEKLKKILQTKYDSSTMKNSIEQMYTQNYMKNLGWTLREINLKYKV